MNTSEKPNRRTFLKTAGAGMAASMLFSIRSGAQSPNEKVRVAFIGCGGIGGSHISGAENNGAVCPCGADADTNHFGELKKRWPEAKTYSDYREMLEKHEKDIDAVMVGTPDHHHYPATVLAMQMGKHVYTQKPLTHTVWEARQLMLAAQKYKVATQMGNQGHANEGNRIIVEYIRSGLLGEIREVHAWTNRPVWPQGLDRPEGEDKVPENLNWDVWLGPAPVRPFKGGVYHPFKWRGWWDFGGGAIADMACHTIDGVFWGMEAKAPTAVEALSATPVNNETFPSASVIKWEFPGNDWRGAFTMYWHDGGLRPAAPIDLEPGRTMPETGNLVLGSKAALLVSGDYGDSPCIVPETKRKELGRPPELIERSPGHMEEWFAACKGAQPIDFPKSSFGYAGMLTETALLGNLALRAGKRLEWNSENLKVTNVPDANQWVTKEYRQGWDFKV